MGNIWPAFDCMHWALSTVDVNDIAGMVHEIVTWASCRDIGGRNASPIEDTERYGYAATIVRALQLGDDAGQIRSYNELI